MGRFDTHISLYLNKNGFWILVICFFSLLFRFLYLFQASDNPFLYVPLVDEEYYVEYAKALISTSSDKTPIGFHMDPLYGFYLAAIYYVFDGNFLPGRLLQIFFDSGTSVLLFQIGLRLGSQKVGALAGLIYAAYPVAWFYDLALLKTSFTAFYLTAYSFGLIRIIDTNKEKTSSWQWSLIGVVAAIGVYLRGYLIFLVIYTPIFLLFYYGIKSARSYKLTAYYVLGVFSILISVGIVNLSLSGQFMVLPGNSGITLYSANSPQNPEGAYSRPSFVKDNHPAHLYSQYKSEAERISKNKLNRKEVSSFWLKQSLSFWFSSIDVLPRLIFNRLLHFMARDEIANNISYTQAARFAPILMPDLPVFSFVLALGVPGLFVAAYHKKNSRSLFLALFVVLTTCLLFYASSRIRFPVVPVLILGSAYLIIYFIKNHKNKASIYLALSSMVIFVISISNRGVALDQRQGELNLAIAYAKLGKGDSALTVLNNIQVPQLGAAGTNSIFLAKYYQVKGFAQLVAKNYTESMQNSALAISVNPVDLIALHNAGVAALHLGDAEKALLYFTKANSLHQDAEHLYWYARALALAGLRDKALARLNEAENQEGYTGDLKTMIEQLKLELSSF